MFQDEWAKDFCSILTKGSTRFWLQNVDDNVGESQLVSFLMM